ncbi:MAG TPA: TIGR03089 family protein [Jatrophihabitantaceae bacterium]|nr:TIGR03089 family protein [Jatrophihabitantaceae bacterium]
MTNPPASPEALFAAVFAAQPSRPLVTYYDDRGGEWGELSARSMANWVAKTYFMLTDALGLGVGDAAFIDLPAHWVSVPALLGCWSAGLTLVSDPTDAAVAFVEPATLARAAGVPDVFAIAPGTAARGFGGEPPAGAEDFVLSVRPHPDAWGSVRFPAGPADAALGTRGRRDVVADAEARAAEIGLAAGGRLLSNRAWHGPADWLDTLLVPLAVGGSVVLVGNADPAKREHRLTQERATAVID